MSNKLFLEPKQAYALCHNYFNDLSTLTVI